MGGPVRYRTIVADPPWPYPDTWPVLSTSPKALQGSYGYGFWQRADGPRPRRGLPYPTMPVEAIQALPVGTIAEPNAHLYLWTTNRYLADAFAVVEAWGFRFAQMLTWCKRPMGVAFGGMFVQTTEHVVVAKRGSLACLRRVDTTWFEWPRGGRKHSVKPEAFYDLVETVSPGPYLELFARRQRLGWDTWGDEALEHVSLGAG
jgi:N6-adenosine-specific RNA methylase IME4